MNRVKSVRTAAAVSLVLVGSWVLLTVVCYILQPYILRLFNSPLPDNRVFLLTTAAEAVQAFIIAAAAVMLYRGRGRYSPLVMSAVTTGVYPAVSAAVRFIQYNITSSAGLKGLVAYSTFDGFTSYLSFLIFVAKTIVIAAGAVNVYAKNREAAGEYPNEAVYK